MPQELIKVPEAAVLRDCSVDTVRRWIRAGVLPAYRVGLREIRVDRADVEALGTPKAVAPLGADSCRSGPTGRR